MTYFPDLSPYSYIRRTVQEGELNVGWLDRTHPHATGPVSEEVLRRVFELCKKPVNKTRGFHYCELCPQPRMGFLAVRGETRIMLGTAEIRVPGKSGIQYASPNMIYHYLHDHNYRPPDEFITAVLELDVDSPKT